MKETSHILIGIGVVVILSATVGCRRASVSPMNNGISLDQFTVGDHQLCYVVGGKIKSYSTVSPTPQTISIGSDYVDEYPQWSPDGRYIVYQHSRYDTVFSPFVYVYDVENKTYTNLTSDGGMASSNPQWAPNGKVYFAYQRPVGNSAATYLMNPDGSNKQRILGTAASIYFYQDSSTFLYFTGTEVHKTNIDSTFDELVLVIPSPGASQFMTIRDFNSLTGELLMNTNMVPGISSAIATFSAETKQTKVIVAAESGYMLALERYSKDFSSIGFVEYDTVKYNLEYLSVYSNGVKKRLVELKGGLSNEWFDYNAIQFSLDGRYLAFSKNITQAGSWFTWKSYLCAVDNSSGTQYYIDEGIEPSWNSYPQTK